MLSRKLRAEDSTAPGWYDPCVLAAYCQDWKTASGLHEVLHHFDCIGSTIGQALLYLEDQRLSSLSDLVKRKIAGGDCVVVPVAGHLLRGSTAFTACSSLINWLYGSSYNSVGPFKIGNASLDGSVTLVGGLSVGLHKAKEGCSAHTPIAFGRDMTGSDYYMRPGLRHVLESRAQIANFWALIDANRDDSLSMHRRFRQILNSPNAHAYSFLLFVSATLWGDKIEERNLYLAIIAMFLIAYAALIVTEDYDDLVRLLLTSSPEGVRRFQRTPPFLEHPFWVYFRLAKAATEEWFTGDWFDFDDVYSWVNHICDNVYGKTLESCIAGLNEALRSVLASKDLPLRRRPLLEAGVKMTRLHLEDPVLVLSPQKLLNTYNKATEGLLPGFYNEQGRWLNPHKELLPYVVRNCLLKSVLTGDFFPPCRGNHGCKPSSCAFGRLGCLAIGIDDCALALREFLGTFENIISISGNRPTSLEIHSTF